MTTARRRFPPRGPCTTHVVALSLALLLLTLGCATPRPEGAADSPDSPGAALDSGAASAGSRVDSAMAGATSSTPTAGQSPVVLEVDRARYPAGAMLPLRIVNRSDVGYGYNACTRVVERREGGEWKPMAEEGRVCTMELRILGPRETATQQVELPKPLAAGEYRLVVTMSRVEGPPPGPGMPTAAPVRATSGSFRVN